MKARRFWLSLIGFVALILAVSAVASRGPDRELAFEREVPSQASREEVSKRLHDVATWPEWHHLLSKAKLVSGETLAVGSRVALTMKPRPWREFTSIAEVVAVGPENLTMRLVEDGSGKLGKAFEGLEWELSLAEKDGSLWVQGRAKARTISWRSRLVSRVTERSVMNQVFYPDLTRLADPARSKAVSPMFDPPPPRKGS